MKLSNLILIALLVGVIMLQLAQADPENPVLKVILEPIKETALEPLKALIGPMLSNAEKQVSALMATLDILFTAGEKIAFSQNFTEKEKAMGEVELSRELLEKQQLDYEAYLSGLQNQSQAMLGNISK